MLRAIIVPVLAIQGADDHNVSIEGSRALMSQLHALGGSNVQYREYPGLDHAFADKQGASHWDRVIDDMSMWLSKRPPRGRQ
jgi:dipeptidyl aminopeptidase/acylaminoacyl peptidase